MKAQLFDVKNKFSEYVNMALDGEVIEVCRHGKPTVAIVNLETLHKKTLSKKEQFLTVYEAWRSEDNNCTLSDSEHNELWGKIEAKRKNALAL